MRNVSTTVYSFVRPSVCWQHEQTVWLLVWPPRGVCWAEWLVTNPAAGPCTNLEAPAVALAFGAGGGLLLFVPAFANTLTLSPENGRKVVLFVLYPGWPSRLCRHFALGRARLCCSMSRLLQHACKTAALRRHVGCIYAKSSLSQCNQIVCLQVAMCVRVR